MSDPKRILIVSEAHLIHTFVTPTITKLKSEAIVLFDCFIVSPLNVTERKKLEQTYDRVYSNEYKNYPLSRVLKLGTLISFFNLRRVSSGLPYYDVVHINYHHFYFAYFSSILRRKAKKLYVTFFGSDFNQVGEYTHRQNLKTLRISDGVFTTNPMLLKKVIARYKLENEEIKRNTLFPLMATFEIFERFLVEHTVEDAKLQFGVDKTVVTCGYSAAKIVRHEKIIEALVENRSLLGDCTVVFPMTYGSGGELTRGLVRQRLVELEIDAKVLDQYLSIEEVQYLRLATDIFVHIQSRDQFSASMLEHLAAGAVVITGKWLPYESLVEGGAYLVLLNHEDELASVLSEVIKNLESHKVKSRVNKEVVFDLVKWENIRQNWLEYYGLKHSSVERV